MKWNTADWLSLVQKLWLRRRDEGRRRGTTELSAVIRWSVDIKKVTEVRLFSQRCLRLFWCQGCVCVWGGPPVASWPIWCRSNWTSLISRPRRLHPSRPRRMERKSSSVSCGSARGPPDWALSFPALTLQRASWPPSLTWKGEEGFALVGSRAAASLASVRRSDSSVFVFFNSSSGGGGALSHLRLIWFSCELNALIPLLFLRLLCISTSVQFDFFLKSNHFSLTGSL